MTSTTPTSPAERSLSGSYARTRAWLHEYFDRTAAKNWETLTSDAPVSGVRATVRAGRDRMRSLLLSWLPTNLVGARVLDAGCGTGAAAVELARRGADVVAIDLSPTLVEVARERAAHSTLRGNIAFRSGDMLDPALGRFDYVIAMDSLIHYALVDATAALVALAPRVQTGIIWTFAPRTPLLATMHTVGKLFPRGDRAPRIVPTRETELRNAVGMALSDWRVGRTQIVKSGFYTSQAMELQFTPRRNS
jgi:magnesium-protoporphyrin O-methyltransferase